MRIKKTRGLGGILLLAAITACSATSDSPQVPDPTRFPPESLLSLERIYESGDFDTSGFGPARWLADGTGYTTLEWSSGELRGREIVRYDPATGEREVLVAVERLVPEGREEPLGIDDYAWSDDGRWLLVFTNTKRVWRVNSRGDYWVLDRESGALRQLGAVFEPSTLMFAKFSPDGTRVAYVQENDIWVERSEDGTITRLTDDGSETIINGNFDWVYEEEFGIRDGFCWSPDGERIAYWQLDAEGVGVFNLIDFTAGLYSEVIPVQYPKAGTTNSSCRIGVVSAGGGETTWMKLEGDSRDNYVARMDWAASSDEVVLQYLNRLQNTNRLMLGDVATGEVRTVLTDRDDAWFEVVDDFVWLDGGKRFTWVSERDGWRHAYLVDRDDGELRAITSGEYDVVSILDIDEEEGWLHFIGALEDATQRYLYRVRLDGKGEPERLTPPDQPGTHAYQVSPSAKWAIHTWSAFEQPPVIELVKLPEHTVARTLVDNREMVARYEALARGSVQFFRVDIGDGALLDGYSMLPPDFDPSREYPVLFYVYGEPWGQTVVDRWGGRNYLWHLMLTQRGYVVMSVDNRGTPSPRGREWRKCIYGGIGVIASADQAAALRAIQERWPWVDAERIGIWGWSGGGSMTLNMMFRHPELYRTGMSIAPVPNQRYYDRPGGEPPRHSRNR